MVPPQSLTRRRFAAACSVLFAGSFAGCADGSPEDDARTSPATASETPTAADGGAETRATTSEGAMDTPSESATTTPSESATTTASESTATTASESTATDELDLREANVVGVAVEPASGGYRFDVSLHHDDGGEAGYANWWQVERRDGTRLGRRELLHPHSRQPFTRSTTVEVPDDVACVVVRGHDETHGYGGQAMVVTLDTGDTRAARQGPEPQDLTDAACP